MSVEPPFSTQLILKAIPPSIVSCCSESGLAGVVIPSGLTVLTLELSSS